MSASQSSPSSTVSTAIIMMTKVPIMLTQMTLSDISGPLSALIRHRKIISFRDQASITRDIASGVSSASSGNSALKISFMADYTLSRLLTLTAYYDQQTNTPLLSSSSYPTTTRDFGLSLKFSLTR